MVAVVPELNTGAMSFTSVTLSVTACEVLGPEPWLATTVKL